MRAVALKPEGMHSPAAGVLARFAELRPIGSLRDLEEVKQEQPDVVLLDIHMPRLEGQEPIDVLRRTRPTPVVILVDANLQPAALLQRLRSLGALRPPREGRPPDLAQAARVLGVSQEALGRVLHVSGRTVHRWLKGIRPRRTQELDRVLALAGRLEQTFPNQDAIRRYLHQASATLQGETPMDLLLRGEGDRVAADLEAVQEGVYV